MSEINETSEPEINDLKRQTFSRNKVTQKQDQGALSLAFLRGYQGGYEDCLVGKTPRHYVRPLEQIKKDQA